MEANGYSSPSSDFEFSVYIWSIVSGFGPLVKEIYQQTESSGEPPRRLERLKNMTYQERLFKQHGENKDRDEYHFSLSLLKREL